ncbi:MAG: Ig-like domain-containing protein [Bacteroidales bacterium]|nr:Ig-like domain-containing protein [Bacteroidales bacterium]
MKKSIYYILLFAITLIVNGCANAVSPSGGPKDVFPPVVVETNPENFSRNIKNKTIHITFDEFVTLDNASKNILISPPQKKSPDFRLNGKVLTIKFEDELRPETTYSINFGSAIKDLHEGNVLKDYVFTFSTGDTIDSLSLVGKTISAETLKEGEDFYVMLYADENDTLPLDSLPYSVMPNYVTKSDKNGKFMLTGLADKNYLLFALKDANSNMIYDIPNEEIGFFSELVSPQYIPHNQVITDSTVVLPKIDTVIYQLNTFVQEDSVQKVFKKELVEDGLLRFAFRYPADNVSFGICEELPDSFSIMKVFSPRKDTISFYFTPVKDSLWISMSYDTINDTTHYSLKPRVSVKPNRRNAKEQEAVKRLGVLSNAKGGKLKPEHPLILSFKEPVVDVVMRDTMWFIDGKDTIFNDLRFTKYDKYGFRFKVEKDFKPEGKYKIIIPDSVFFGISGLTNDTTKLDITVPEISQYGNIYITVEVPENVPQAVVQLLSGEKILDSKIIKETQEIEFEYLDAGKYKLKAILDTDSNGLWSPGNFIKKMQPEKIVFYKTELEVKANWDIDLDEPWEL